MCVCGLENMYIGTEFTVIMSFSINLIHLDMDTRLVFYTFYTGLLDPFKMHENITTLFLGGKIIN